MADSSNSAASEPSRRNFLKVGAGVVGGLVIGGAVAYVAKPSMTSTSTQTQTATETTTLPPVTSTLTNTVTSSAPPVTSTVTTTATTTATTSDTSSIASLQGQLLTYEEMADGFLALNSDEQPEIEAIAETMIPTDSNGPGAKEAGVIYFIDRQLATDYGKNGNWYIRAPYVPANLPGPITVKNLAGQPVNYSGGSAYAVLNAGTAFQWGPHLMREFWRQGLIYFNAYCTATYGGNFSTLSAANQVTALQDLWNNKPTNFADIIPQQFFNEVYNMVWWGFLTDPLYGGNRGMVGWQLTGFNGTNTGDFYNEGYTSQQLMLSTTPIPLKPASLAQLQAATNGKTLGD